MASRDHQGPGSPHQPGRSSICHHPYSGGRTHDNRTRWKSTTACEHPPHLWPTPAGREKDSKGKGGVLENAQLTPPPPRTEEGLAPRAHLNILLQVAAEAR